MEQVLENVCIQMEAESGEGLEEEAVLPLALMPYGTLGLTYVVMKRESKFTVDKFACTLKFKVREIDPSTGEAEEEGYEDEYQLEDLEVLSSSSAHDVLLFSATSVSQGMIEHCLR